MKPHHFKRTDHLVQLAAGNAQRCGIGGREIGLTRLRRLSGIPGQCLVGRIQRLAQLIEHPRQGTKVGDGDVHCVGICAVGVHKAGEPLC
jgi:hypothetical protein